jgi:hypothetical protein
MSNRDVDEEFTHHRCPRQNIKDPFSHAMRVGMGGGLLSELGDGNFPPSFATSFLEHPNQHVRHASMELVGGATANFAGNCVHALPVKRAHAAAVIVSTPV